MKQALKIAGFIVRLGLGLGIVAYLLYRIDTHTSCIDFKLETPAAVRIGTTYADGSNTVRLFVVLEDLNGGNILKTVQRKGTAQLAGTGTLTPVTDASAPCLPWTSWTTSRSGLRFLGDIISGTLARWPWVMSGLLLFFVGIILVTIRWKLILDTQNLAITWARVFSISFVGVFFNSFMPGSVGGDLVRGYYTSRESEDRKTELFLSVIIDRILGLPSVFLLPLAVLAIQPQLTFANPMTKTVFIALASVCISLVSMFFLVFKRDLFEKYAFLKRLEQKAALGAVIRRAYDAVRLCVTHPALVAKGFALSMLGQIAGVSAGFCLARSLGEPVPFLDFFALYMMALFIASLPITPGGLGLREAAMVLLLSAAGVPAVTSVALSLLVYLGALLCGATGALAFIFFSGPQGRAPAAAAPDPAHP